MERMEGEKDPGGNKLTVQKQFSQQWEEEEEEEKIGVWFGFTNSVVT